MSNLVPNIDPPVDELGHQRVESLSPITGSAAVIWDGQTMPGPLAALVAMWVGFLRRGPLGSASVAAAVVAPSFVMVVIVGAIYARYSGLAVVQSLFYGIAPAVMAIITIAAVKLVRMTDGRDWRLWGISAVIFALTAFTGSEPILVIIGAGLLTIGLDARPSVRLPRRRRRDVPPLEGDEQPDSAPAIPMIIGLGTLAGAGTLTALALFFLKTGAIVFGSGLAIVPFLLERRRPASLAHRRPIPRRRGYGSDHSRVGRHHRWVIGCLVAGLPGAIVATVAIFIPIYLGVVVPGRWFLRHRDNSQIRAFVTGATVAAAGALSGAVVVLTRQAVTDWITAAIGLATLALLWRFKIQEPYIVLGAGLLGILLH